MRWSRLQTPNLARPAGLFEREMEWAELGRFAASAAGSPRLGLVFGRRRQGRSFVLEHLLGEDPSLVERSLYR